MKRIILWLLLNLVMTNAFANELQERIYLTQILNELNTLQPLILSAQVAQEKNRRIQFHYTRYRDDQGKIHNGLLEDIQAIKLGITQALNQAPIEPRIVTPLNGDYVGE